MGRGSRQRSRSLSVGSANSHSSERKRGRRRRSASDAGKNKNIDDTNPKESSGGSTDHKQESLDAKEDNASQLSVQNEVEDKGSTLSPRATTSRKKRSGSKSESLNDTSSQVDKIDVEIDDAEKRTGVGSNSDIAENQQPGDSDLAVKRPPTLDVVVHRVRNLDYLPSSIVCMRATPIKSKYDCLAISRGDGSVELRATSQKFRTLAIVAGRPGKEVNALAWIMPPNETENIVPVLVGGSQDGSLFVVDFQSLSFKSMASSGGGGIFALESLYQSSGGGETSGASLVAAACEDGSVRIFQLTPDNALSLSSTIPTTGAAVLSLAWRRMEQTASPDTMSGTAVFAGVADGTIRTFTYGRGDKNKRSGWKSGHRMTAESLGRRIPTRIWSLKLLIDWTLVSSDSLGNIQFWDGKTGSLEQTFQQSEQKADVLDIDVSSDECSVFASGVDSRVVNFERPSKDSSDFGRRWVLSHAYRPHTHDVKSVAICYANNGDTEPKREMLCTGGIDMKLCTYLTQKFNRKRPRTLYPWPDKSLVFLSKKSRIFAILKNARVDIHKLHENPSELMKPVAPKESSLLGTFEIKTRSNLTCGAFNDDGKLMAVCDSASVFVLRLNQQDFTPSRIPVAGKVRSAVSSISFNGNSTIIVAAADGEMHVFQLKQREEKERFVLMQSFSPEMDGAGRIAKRLPVSSISLSLDSGKWLAGLNDEYDGSTVDIYVREANKYRHWWTLPKLANTITAISFIGEGSDTKLVVGCTNYDILVFDVGLRKTDSWGCTSGGEVRNAVEREMASRYDYPLQVCIHPSNKGKAILRSTGVFLVVDLLQEPPSICRTVPEKHVRRKKRKRGQSLGNAEDTEGVEAVQCLRYNSMLFMGYSGDHELLIVEQPWLNVVATLPEAIQRRIYGT